MVTNYKAVSVLPVLSLVLEKLMFKRLNICIIRHNVLYKFQFGFRERYRTNLALVVLINKILKALKEVNTFLCIP